MSTGRKLLDVALGVFKSLKHGGAISWRYFKVEGVPPLTVSLFQGPFGRNLESFFERIMNGIINTIQGQIRSIELQKERAIKEKEAALKAILDKKIAEDKKKEEKAKAAAKAIAEAAKKAAEARAAEAKAAEAKAAEKKKDVKKGGTKQPATKPAAKPKKK